MSERDDSSCLNLEQFVHWFFSSDSLDETVMATIVSHGTTRTGNGVERGVGQTSYCGGHEVGEWSRAWPVAKANKI